MRRVIIESPFAGCGPWLLNLIRRWLNVRYARQCVRDAVLRGESPIASHLLFTQRGILDDKDPAERQMGIEADLAWGRGADATVAYTDRGISKGMKAGIKRAEAEGRLVEQRTLWGGQWWQ
jgi:hypothetical protein